MGDYETAIEILRKQGQKLLLKRADRDSSEGAVIAKVNADYQRCDRFFKLETDFAAKK
jgi:elongation factor Ts